MVEKTRCSGWTVCWAWIFPYPCKKSWDCWCYTFEWLKEDRFGFFCRLEGCENGIKYKWYAFCFMVFGSKWFFNIKKCFKSPRDEVGKC